MNDKKILQFPKQRPDVQEMMLDGKPETMLSARGVVLMLLSAWKLDGNEKAHDGLRRYCEYIGVHGYRGGASKALEELDKLGKGADAAWVRHTFAQYVEDQNALIQYVMGALARELLL